MDVTLSLIDYIEYDVIWFHNFYLKTTLCRTKKEPWASVSSSICSSFSEMHRIGKSGNLMALKLNLSPYL